MNIWNTIKKHAVKYAIGSLVASITALLMTKYYTSVLSPSDFGILAMYLVMFKYITVFCSMDMQSGSTRLYFDYEGKEKHEYINTIAILITIISAIVFVFGILLQSFISPWIEIEGYSSYILVIFSGIISVYVAFFTRILINEQKSSFVMKNTLMQTFFNHSTSFYLMHIMQNGIFARLLGQSIGLVASFFLVYKDLGKVELTKFYFCFNKSMAKETIKLSFPTMLATLQTLIFSYLDRIFLKHFNGDHAVGVYSLGFILGQGISIIYESIAQAILPKVYSGLNEDYEKSRSELETFSFYYYIALLVITISTAYLSPFIIKFFSNDNYIDSSLVLPFIVVGFMIAGFYKIPALMLSFHKLVWFYPILAFTSFGVNAVLNWLLIPSFGVLGAAFSSFVGLYLYSITLQLLAFKYFSVKYRVLVSLIYCAVFLFVVIGFFEVKVR
ncbi:oligosaccharide flippase family protein [Vibrio cyclitrophicus]|uniref:oligosaccharide flippase family protein n=1 Tax=Vibrio cyclitrophicus TaxID=47951 RepID=UPI0002F5B6A8|nr:oligosaccharide flippase family protein [Vibrio cyclitrophicus]ERM59218.1 Polysaccharide biosynthesis protein [Vibrio cyclitrophicus FF75]OEE47432.1 polysaccharide biosynthesis protein [Vibrio cyclitrophicus FF75]